VIPVACGETVKADDDVEVEMSAHPDRSSECKNHILGAAAAVFARGGFRTARMDDRVEQAGL